MTSFAKAGADRLDFFLCLLLFAFLFPFMYVESRMSMSADVAWLTMGAGYFLDGLSMTHYYYDTNPPMSFLIYLPAAALVKLGLPLWIATFVYTVALMAVSYILVAAIFRSWPHLDKARYWGILTAFIVFSTFPTRYEFGQKDHMIALALLPLLAAQYAKTFNHAIPRWLWRAAIVFAVPFILLKPHYGLLPVLMLAHRAWKQRRINIVFDFDFIALAVGVVTYVCLVLFLFPDFLTEVVKASILFYVSSVRTNIFPMTAGFALLALCVTVFALVADKDQPLRRTAIFLSLASLISIIPVFVQFKGFSYHLLPPLALLGPAAFLSFSLHQKALEKSRPYLPFLTVAAIFALGYLALPPNTKFPTHRDYPETTLGRYVATHAKDSTFFLQADTTNIVYPLMAYTGIRHASRFPCAWYLPGIAMADSEESRAMKVKFAGYVAEDLRRDKPAFVGLFADPDPMLDFLAILGDDPVFAAEWAHYRKKERIPMDYAEYFRGTLHEHPPAFSYPAAYDIYERVN